MGVIYIKKKKGTSFLEIIIALSIIGIISVAVFNNIYFSLKVNKEIDGKQNSSILAQHVFEEIKNMGKNTFKELANKTANQSPYDSGTSFLGSDYDEISDSGSKGKFGPGESSNSFKVFRKRDTELYVKVSLPELSTGLINENSSDDDNNHVKEWKNISECQVVMEITEHETENSYNVRIYRDGVVTYDEVKTKEDILPKVILTEENLEVYLKKDRILGPIIAEGDMFIRDTTGEDFSYILSNDGKIELNLYIEQITASNSGFTTYGRGIKVYKNYSDRTPDGETITTDSLYNFTVSVFKEQENYMKKMIELKGHKKIKRFKI